MYIQKKSQTANLVRNWEQGILLFINVFPQKFNVDLYEAINQDQKKELS
jgi:hypothetical protein